MKPSTDTSKDAQGGSTPTPSKAAGFQSFILKALQTAVIADQAYEQEKTAGAGSLLQPGNFDTLLTELATVFAPAKQE